MRWGLGVRGGDLRSCAVWPTRASRRHRTGSPRSFATSSSYLNNRHRAARVHFHGVFQKGSLSVQSPTRRRPRPRLSRRSSRSLTDAQRSSPLSSERTQFVELRAGVDRSSFGQYLLVRLADCAAGEPMSALRSWQGVGERLTKRELTGRTYREWSARDQSRRTWRTKVVQEEPEKIADVASHERWCDEDGVAALSLRRSSRSGG